MTARKDDKCPIKSIFCHKRPKQAVPGHTKAIPDHEKAIPDHEKAIHDHNRSLEAMLGSKRPFENQDFLFN